MIDEPVVYSAGSFTNANSAVDVEEGLEEGSQGLELQLPPAVLRVHRVHEEPGEAELGGDPHPVEGEVHPVAGRGAERAGVDPARGEPEERRVVEEGLGEGGHPEADRGGDGPLEVGVAGHGHHGLGLGAIEERGGGLQRGGLDAPERVADVEAEGDEDLIVAAPPGVDLLAGVAEALDEVRLDGGVPVLVALVEHEAARLEEGGEIGEGAVEGLGLGGGEHAGASEPVDVGPRRAHVREEEGAIEDHVVAGAKTLDAGVDRGTRLVPDHTGHGSIPRRSGKPNARLRFCTAWLAAPLRRLSSVETTTACRRSGSTVKPPIVACGWPAASRTRGISPVTRTRGSSR
jgi:hypothetical protein